MKTEDLETPSLPGYLGCSSSMAIIFKCKTTWISKILTIILNKKWKKRNPSAPSHPNRHRKRSERCKRTRCHRPCYSACLKVTFCHGRKEACHFTSMCYKTWTSTLRTPTSTISAITAKPYHTEGSCPSILPSWGRTSSSSTICSIGSIFKYLTRKGVIIFP